jgi:hypothetical protein
MISLRGEAERLPVILYAAQAEGLEHDLIEQDFG